MSRTSASTQRRRFSPALLLLLASGVLAISAWSAISSPALASVLNLGPTASIQPLSYAQAYIVKPAYTATSVPRAQPTPELETSDLQSPVSNLSVGSSETVSTQPTETAPVVGQLQAVIVDDGSPPENSVSAPDAPPAYSGNKYILVDISDQYMYVYEGDTLVQSFIASTGMRNATRVGTFSVLDKIPNAYGSTWDIWMPNWLGIYYAGGSENGIHALPILPNGAILWEGFLGTPISYGCVVLGTYDSQWLYDWAEIGTPVEIRW